MKITKTQLTQLIKEELDKSIEEEVVQEVYWPFIGGKVDADKLYRAKSRLEHSRERLNKYKSAMEDSDIELAEDFMSRMEKVLKSISKRHSKQEFEHAEAVWVRRQKDVEEILDAGSKAWNKQNRANDAEEYERICAEKAREARRKRSDREDSRRAYEKSQQDDSDDAFMGQHHRSNPGFAGSANMGYGESLDRAKISKSELAQIIKEELNKVLHNEAREDHISGIEGRLEKELARLKST
jgi:hypothetical protein